MKPLTRSKLHQLSIKRMLKVSENQLMMNKAVKAIKIQITTNSVIAS